MLCMVTWIPSIYPLYVSIYTSTMDPSWVLLINHDYITILLVTILVNIDGIRFFHIFSPQLEAATWSSQHKMLQKGPPQPPSSWASKMSWWSCSSSRSLCCWNSSKSCCCYCCCYWMCWRWWCCCWPWSYWKLKWSYQNAGRNPGDLFWFTWG